MKEKNLIAVRCEQCGYEWVCSSEGKPDPTKLECKKCGAFDSKPVGPWIEEVKQ